MQRRTVLIAALTVFIVYQPCAAEKPSWMMRADVRGQRLEGVPLWWSEQEVQFLARDGRLWGFRPGEAQNFEQTAPSFRGYSPSEIRARLEAELGGRFDITSTGHYVVAHPRGERDHWAERFEELFRSFQHYFSVRGFRLERPQFPLVAIVWKNQEEFAQAAIRDGARFSPGLLGYYSPQSNRIMLYDVTRGQPQAEDWHSNAETIIHEASHQTAFNTGVHSRFGETPRWVAEGLGTMFEAEGVWNSRRVTGVENRINRARLRQFKEYVGRRRAGALAEFIASDRAFNTDVDAAYAEAWALSFFLAETDPRKYMEFLARTARRPAFEAYPQAQRVADFTSVFGRDLRLLEARFLSFIEQLNEAE